MSATSVFCESSKEHDRFSATMTRKIIPTVYFSIDNLNKSSLFDQCTPKLANPNNMIMVQEPVSTSANKNNYLGNCNLKDRDPTKGFLTLPIFDESIIFDATMNENIINSNGVMVADMNGNIDVPVDREIINNEEIKQIGTAALSKSNTRKKVKNVTKWKRVAAKIARLKVSPYHSTVAKKELK
ncbi:unnamed protein product [Parnassius apollo]|uniref:(apollo) hypothetical protein n=1 Tax=Parnassius apollo TaxID=110799 RepID=A0A8S3W4I9_PARAO|nr:unnamed protein product [Parnassius apollo]